MESSNKAGLYFQEAAAALPSQRRTDGNVLASLDKIAPSTYSVFTFRGHWLSPPCWSWKVWVAAGSDVTHCRDSGFQRNLKDTTTL
eukprot:9293778-Pyramimonas_sp.AAC.1